MAYRIKVSGPAACRIQDMVSGNWRVTFCLEGKDADVDDYEDYH